METIINIDAPELERAIRFYTEAFGLQLQRRLFENMVAEVSGTSTAIYLVQKIEVEPESYAWGKRAALSDPFVHGFCFIHQSGHDFTRTI